MIEYLINSKTKINVALKRFDKLGGKSIYVINNKKKLVGSLTDGDWRRESLNGKTINNTVESICNKNPTIGNTLTPLADIKKLFVKHKQMTSIPIVNNKNQIIKIILRYEIQNKKLVLAKKSSTPVIIMAGGKGTRLSPFTEVLPKPLIPIKGKTIITRIIEKFKSVGFNNFYISINEKSKIIKSYFEEKNLKKKITFIEEKKALGTIGSLSKLSRINTKKFFVTSCDTLINYDFNKITKFHLQNKNSLTILVVKKKYTLPYGVCYKNNKNELINMDEKPEHEYLVNIGSYVIDKRIIKLLKVNQYCDFNNFVEILQKKNEKIGLYEISERKCQDTGTWKEYKRTVSLMS